MNVATKLGIQNDIISKTISKLLYKSKNIPIHSNGGNMRLTR
jgi:hypothetical protein